MSRKALFLGICVLGLCVQNSRSQPIPGYYERSKFLMASPGTFGFGLVGHANPANLALLPKFEAQFNWSTEGEDLTSLQDWGLFLGGRRLGFSILQQEFGSKRVTDYKISIAGGNRGAALGLAYGWSKSKYASLARDKILTTGLLVRPSPYFSLGVIGNLSLDRNAHEGVIDLGIRPFGNPHLTLFADAALQDGMKISAAKWSYGAAFRILPGVHLIGRYFENESFTGGLSINFGRGGMAGQSHFDRSQDFAHNSYLIRSGVMMPSIFPTLFDKDKKYVPISLKGRVDYHKYRLFDMQSLPFARLLDDIKTSGRDPRVAALALNLSGMKIRPEHAWEIREVLKSVQRYGKKVLIFIDNAGMTTYHLASVADRIVMDPEGNLALPGLALSRTFLKGTLEKLGLAFDEWRFFEYKSAAEVLSRESMSPADKEQRQDYLDDWYEMIRSEVCQSRELSPDEFDRIVDDQIYLLADMALEQGLIDAIGRWSAKDEIIADLFGRRLTDMARKDLLGNSVASDAWGEPSKIALVYGLGECAMDTGIRARWLEKVFLRLRERDDVRAVVFRVDSPGGDGMASDLVAEAIKKCRERKPVIVSQGQVAGSGGYWISMYGDQIVAAPNTLTGSIGVIGGWIYDAGFSEKIGMTSDLVKRGAHADLWYGVSLPYIGTIPSRNLNPDERGKMERLIKLHYENFVRKVAQGRNMSPEEVKKIAEGHFYSGEAGKKIGLVDEIGGLLTALELAQQQGGLDKDDEVEILEIPQYKGLIDLGIPSSPIRAEIESDPVITFIKMVNKQRGKPLYMLLPGSYPVYSE